MSRSMKTCEKRERDRQRKWRTSAQGRFEASMLSLDALPPSCTRGEAWESDGGEGAERIVRHCDGELSAWARKLAAARKKLRRAHPELVAVFNLIVKNGSNRKESIWALMQSRKRANGTRQSTSTGDT